MSLKSFLKKNKTVIKAHSWLNQKKYEMATLISPEVNTKIRYKAEFGKKLDLDNPITLNEKILWLKLNRYMNHPLVIQCADKYRVREYIQQAGCEDILNDLIGAWDSADEIPWEDLPNQFVLKWNFGAGMNIICSDKSKLDKKTVIRQMRKWGRKKAWLSHSEMQYKYAPKKIVCEKFLTEDQTSTKIQIADYKVYCFNGKPMFTMVCLDRDLGHPKFYFFDNDWNLARINKDSKNAPEDFTMEKPKCLDKLLDCATKLSNPFPFVRADFYVLGSDVYFGELTFTPSGGLDSNRLKETDIMMGSLVDIQYTQGDLLS